MTDWTPQQQAEHRATLCEALRSGQYNQTDLNLRRRTSQDNVYYCVMGVACDVSGLGEWVKTVDSEAIYTYIVDSTDGLNSFERPSAYPPYVVTDYYGLNLHRYSTLLVRNDSGDMTFEELADFIEEQS